jgi:hypothetical protein
VIAHVDEQVRQRVRDAVPLRGAQGRAGVELPLRRRWFDASRLRSLLATPM